jgi:hypothetical protein
MSQPTNTNIVDLVRRRDYFDVFIDGVNYGSGSWGAVTTAAWFYNLEGMSVSIKNE